MINLHRTYIICACMTKGFYAIILGIVKILGVFIMQVLLQSWSFIQDARIRIIRKVSRVKLSPTKILFPSLMCQSPTIISMC